MKTPILPPWVNSPQLEEDDLRKKRTKFAIKLAAVYANECGTIAALARSLKITDASLHAAVERGHVGATTAVRIEKLTDGAVPKELLNDAFLTP